ncbi:MAG TPA: hypothetical protein VMT00_13230 [Thermoanaerobaculia bacterium]|nr:hypothetical protein [Thermoanaerobaculia bacterium]
MTRSAGLDRSTLAGVKDHFYASALTEQVWVLEAGSWSRRERRTDIGGALARVTADGLVIRASDRLSDFAAEVDVREVQNVLDATFAGVPIERELLSGVASAAGEAAAVRSVRGRVAVQRDDDALAARDIDYLVFIDARRSLSIVTTRDRIEDELRIFSSSDETTIEVDHRTIPIVWRNGSAAVLLHEAIGHPAEHGAPAAPWPKWLVVADDPEASGMLVDDAGERVSRRILTAGEQPSCRRREGFRDVPLHRMTTLVVECGKGALDLPARRLEVLLTGTGEYDAAADSISLAVDLAELVEGDRRRRAAPFVLRARRDHLARSIAGAGDRQARYPGVLCSREGQRLYAGSIAPDLSTSPLEHS